MCIRDRLELFNESEEGVKLINVYCDGIKLAIKFVEAEAIITNNNARLTIRRLSKVPIISVGFVSILGIFCEPCFKIASKPATINRARKEKIIKFKIKLRFPFLSSSEFLT